MSSEQCPRRLASRSTCVMWYTILCLIGLASIWWPLFNRVEPLLFGLPFFIWFQTLLIAISAVLTGLAYKAGA